MQEGHVTGTQDQGCSQFQLQAAKSCLGQQVAGHEDEDGGKVLHQLLSCLSNPNLNIYTCSFPNQVSVRRFAGPNCGFVSARAAEARVSAGLSGPSGGPRRGS